MDFVISRDFLKNIKNADERLLVSKVIDKAELCLKYYEPSFTDFIPPTNINTVLQIIKFIPDINYMVFGGIEECERRKIGFVPDYMELSEKSFPISAVKISVNKFSSGLSHRDFLGSVLGLGIERGKIGDIIISENEAICFADEDIAQYIAVNLEKVGRQSVKAQLYSLDQLQMPEKNIQFKDVTVSSMRFDTVLAAGFNLARSKAKDFIEGEKAFVNWTNINDLSYQIKEGDIISLRGMGRFKVENIKGKTKKDRIALTIGKYV